MRIVYKINNKTCRLLDEGRNLSSIVIHDIVRRLGSVHLRFFIRMRDYNNMCRQITGESNKHSQCALHQSRLVDSLLQIHRGLRLADMERSWRGVVISCEWRGQSPLPIIQKISDTSSKVTW